MKLARTGSDCEAIHEGRLNLVSGRMPPDMLFDRMTDFYRAFADPTRAKILWALKKSEMCVGDLAVLLNMTKSAISHQLKTLRLTRLVKFDKRGKLVYYSLSDAHIGQVMDCGFDHSLELGRFIRS